MQGNSAPMSGCAQKVLSCIKARSTSQQLHHDIVHTPHDSVMTGHPGQWKTLELVSHNYWWPGISHYVASYMAGCNVCNHCKSFPTQKVGKLTPNQIPTWCWEVISVDTIGEQLESKGCE